MAAAQDDVYGAYRVLDALGHGAMGIVYRAHDPRLDRLVALKLVLPAGATRDASKARARLVAEARALARVSHPNVLAVYDVGVRDDVVFVALELVDGVDLARWLRSRPRPWSEVVRVFDGVAAGLAAVHAAGLVHRDVKPDNVLIERARPGHAMGRVLLADFGIARAVGVASTTPPAEAENAEPDQTPLTEAGRVVGTPSYMAPEQHAGREVGPAADQYAFCVALYEALYRKRPFVGDVRALMRAKLSPPEAPPTSEVPASLWSLVRRGLSPRPCDRFASMTDLRDALIHRARAPRRIAVVLGAAVVAGTTITWSFTRVPTCERNATRLDEVWNDTRAAAIAQVFASADRPGAEQIWDRVSTRIDAHARDLAAMYSDACDATYVRGDESERMFDRRMVCLDRHRRALEQSLALLEGADADVVDHAEDLASALGVEDCADRDALEAGIAAPAPAQREAVETIERVLADAGTLQVAGRYSDAAATAEVAVDLARSVDHPPVLVKALTLSAELHERQSRIDEARAALDEAIAVGMDTGIDTLVVRAVVLRTWIAAEYERDVDAAETFAALGRSLLERVGNPREQRLGLHNSLATAYVAAGRHADALREYEAALAEAEDDPALASWTATLLANGGGAYFRLGRLERASESYTRALEILRAAHGDDHPLVLGTSLRLAQVHSQMGRHTQAIAELRTVIASFERSQAPPIELASALVALGASLRNDGADDEASETYRRAVDLLDDTGDDVTLAHALVNYGASCIDRGILDAAEIHFRRSVTLLEPIDPGADDLVNAWIGIGDIRERQARPEEALSAYRHAHDIAAPRTRMQARTLVALARAHQRAGRHDEALALLDRQDQVLAAAPLVLLGDRLAPAIVRVESLVDAGRVGDASPAIEMLDELLDEARASGGSTRAGEGELVLGRARLARGEREPARAAFGRAVAQLHPGRSPELVARARSALAGVESSALR